MHITTTKEENEKKEEEKKEREKDWPTNCKFGGLKKLNKFLWQK